MVEEIQKRQLQVNATQLMYGSDLLLIFMVYILKEFFDILGNTFFWIYLKWLLNCSPLKQHKVLDAGGKCLSKYP